MNLSVNREGFSKVRVGLGGWGEQEREKGGWGKGEKLLAKMQMNPH